MTMNTKNEKPTCWNCYYYWGCRMSDNPRLDDDPDGRPCYKWRPKEDKPQKTE